MLENRHAAEAACQRALQLAPYHFDARLGLGLLLLERDDLDGWRHVVWAGVQWEYQQLAEKRPKPPSTLWRGDFDETPVWRDSSLTDLLDSVQRLADELSETKSSGEEEPPYCRDRTSSEFRDRAAANAEAARRFLLPIAESSSFTLDSVTPELICKVHRILCDGVPFLDTPHSPLTPRHWLGVFRSRQLFAGALCPPSPSQILPLLVALIAYLKRVQNDGAHPLVVATLTQHYLLVLHPFYDGNGRLARTIGAFLAAMRDERGRGGITMRNFYLLAKHYQSERETFGYCGRLSIRGEQTLLPYLRLAAQGAYQGLQAIRMNSAGHNRSPELATTR
ncbi:MAG: Fic family protein [Gammaproteobacteria bacterium]|nr:Fic family protein [Gammaproteobacteria bacterium]